MMLRRSFLSFPAIGCLFLAGCAKTAPESAAIAPSVAGNRVIFPANAPQRTSLTVATTEPHPKISRQVTGRLVWNEDLTVRIYAPIEGRVAAVIANLGDTVEKGAALARLDSPDFGQAQADVRKAAADFQLAERTLNRARDLFAHGAVARKDVESAEDAFVGAQSEQQRAAGRLARYEAVAGKEIDGYFVLRSPLPGTVVEKNINSGQELRPDLMLANAPQLLAPQFVVSDPRELWVLLDVSESDIGLLQPGQSLLIRSRAFPERTFQGKLTLIGQSLDPATRTIRARGNVDNAAQLLKAEMYVDVDIVVPEANQTSVAVASSAVFTKDDRHYVFVEAAPGSFERREVEPGAESAGRIVVLRGLAENERVLIEGSLLVEAVLEAGGKS